MGKEFNLFLSPSRAAAASQRKKIILGKGEIKTTRFPPNRDVCTQCCSFLHIDFKPLSDIFVAKFSN